MNDKPRFIKDQYILTLDYLKASGQLEQGCASTKLQEQYGLSYQVASAVVAYWLTQQGKELVNIYVYIQSRPGLWQVGYYLLGNWVWESDHDQPSEAARRVAFLNGCIS
jgi:hypothetical protein